MVALSSWSGRVEPDYFQFYVRRAQADWASAEVSEDGYRDRLWSNGDFVYVGTLRKFGSVPIRVNLFDQPPGGPPDEWQHIAEVSLDQGGPLEVFNWNADEPLTTVMAPSGTLRLRVLWKGLMPGRFEGMDQDGTSDEQIAMEIWASAPDSPSVVRRWDGWPW